MRWEDCPVEPVILGEIGSIAHGLGVAESDHDYHGVYIDPPEVLLGLKSSLGAVRLRDKPEGVCSGPGDSEGTLYGLRKFAQLCAQGNPTVLTLLFTPNLKVPDRINLQAHRDMFLSKQIATRHMGYADSMYRRLTGDLAPRTNRPDLIAKHGYDTKAAFHALRLLIQGHEMLIHGTMTMPMHDGFRNWLLAIRDGKASEATVLNEIALWRATIQDAEAGSPLPDRPDMDKINNWLIDTHAREWATILA
jgi:uncharacterized protein